MSEDQFQDKFGRNINIEADDNQVIAYHRNRNIGKIDIDFRDDGYFSHPILFGMEVDQNYRRAGIATEMMRWVVDIHGPDIGRPEYTALGSSQTESTEYFTNDGNAFVRHCVEIGLLNEHERREDLLDD